MIRRLEIDPALGKPLRGNLAGKWSLRIGDYRIIYAINENEKMVLLYAAKHRKTVYQ